MTGAIGTLAAGARRLLVLLGPAAALAIVATAGPAPASAAAVAPAAAPPLSGTAIRLTLPPPTRTGQSAALAGSLVSNRGALARAAVHLLIDGVPELTLQTGADGSFQHQFSRSLPAGDHAISLWYHGSQPLGLAPASAAGTLTLLPLVLTLQSLPALAGVTFTVDGEAHVTDARGSVQAGVRTAGAHRVGVAPPPDTDTARYRLTRWLDGETVADREVRMFSDLSAVAAFSSTFLVPMTFVDSEGKRLDPRRLSHVTAVAPGGETILLAPSGGSAWLTVAAPAQTAHVGREPSARFILASAQFDGVSVANRGDDAYVPGPGHPWTIRLRVFSLRVRVRQPVVGSGPGSVVVRSDSGLERTARAGAGGEAVIRELPRGMYEVSVPGGQIGPGPRVLVTQSQAVNVSAFTAGEAVPGAVALVLALAGAAALARMARRRLRPIGRPTGTGLAAIAARLVAITGGRR
jgi:hypothetical protein